MAESKPRRPKGTGSVRNKGTERTPKWEARYFVTVDGRRQQVSSSGYRLKKDAEQWLRDELKRQAEGRETVPGKLTVSKLLDLWLDDAGPRLSQNTRSEYARQVRLRLKPQLGETKLAELRPLHITRMLADLRKPGADKRSKVPKPLAETTLQHTLGTLRTALAWAVRHHYVAYNHAADLDRPKRDSSEMTVWAPPELATFMSSIAEHRLAPLLRLAAFTGMRRSELLGLTWRAVDLDAGTVRVRRVAFKDGYEMVEEERTKSARGRRPIDIDPTTVAVLRGWARAQKEERLALGHVYSTAGHVFTSEDGSALTGDHVYQVSERLIERASVPRIRFHDLRHTHASILLMQGVPVVDVAERLGDSVATVQTIYAHFIPGRGGQTAALFAAAIDAPGRGTRGSGAR